MKRAVRLALRPSSATRRVLNRCAWARRLSFNAALAWHRSEHAAGRPVPSEFATAAWLRSWRKMAAVEKPELALVPARVFEYAAEDLERAWKGMKGGSGAPRFDRFDPVAGGFAVDGSIVVSDAHIRLPRIGEARLMPNVRPAAKSGRLPAGKYFYARVVKEHGEWFVSVLREVPDPVRVTDLTPTIGLDPGVRKMATLSDGTRFENPRALQQVAVKAEKARLSIARKQRAADKKAGGPPKKGERRASSQRLTRARRKLGKQLQRSADIRKNAIDHATSAIALQHAVVAVEDTPVRNMTRKRKGQGRSAKARLNRLVLDAAPGMFLRILDQKLRDRRGGGVIRVHAAYTSQDCSRCDARTDCGADETYTCAACGLVIDRDVNAANNILARARVAAAGWSPAEKSAWSESPLRVRKTERPKAPVSIREQRLNEAA